MMETRNVSVLSISVGALIVEETVDDQQPPAG